MTAVASGFRSGSRTDEPIWRRVAAGPRHGWASALLLGGMLWVVGLAIDDAKWVGYTSRGQSQTGFLLITFVLAGAVGLVFARMRLSTAKSHLLGAVIGAAFVLIAASGSISDSPELLVRLRALNESVARFANDLVAGARSSETSAFLLAIGAIAWTTGYFAAFNVFRRGRSMPAVVAIGLVLLINMSITARIQYPHLVLFAICALLLLVRVNLSHQQTGWRRRHIGDSGDVSGLFMRGGAVFVLIALIGSLGLAATASSAPLASFWRNLDDQIVNLGLELNRIVGGVTGTTKQAGGLFGSTQTIRGVWEATSEVVFTARTADGQQYYWRGATYDGFDGQSWIQQDRTSHGVPALGELLAGTADALPADRTGRSIVPIQITSIDLAGGTMVAPEWPIAVDRPTDVRTKGDAGPLSIVDFQEAVDPGEKYTVTVLAADGGGLQQPFTANQLAAAGVNYPAWAEHYTEIKPNSIGDLTSKTAAQVVGRLAKERRDPFHIADAVQRYLFSEGGFQYDTDVRSVCSSRESVVDCLLRSRRGYCEHFASAMVMMLRTQRIPARLVEGYLPGKKLPDGSYEIDGGAAHAWVEVYFPKYGWARFDPTPGNFDNGQTPTRLVTGAPVATPPTVNGVDEPPSFTDPAVPPNDGGPIVQPPYEAPPGTFDVKAGLLGPLAVSGLLIGALILAIVARRRRLFAPEPDLAYRGVTRLASRFGYGPRPTQTAYEYAGSLSEVLPGIRTELHVVAHAKVESTYARRPPRGAALEALRIAYRKVRLGLLRLFFRRPGRRHGR